MRESQTHFEQISVETVKKIATDITQKETVISIAATERARLPIPPEEHWREIAEKVQQERDPSRMIELVQQLITTFDERRRRSASK